MTERGSSGPIVLGEERPRQEYHGIAASSGVGIGPAFVVERGRVSIERAHVDRAAVDDEVRRFRTGLRATHEQLETIKSRLAHGEHRQIIKAQQLMLRDRDLIARVEELVRVEAINAEWAVSRVVEETVGALAEAEDEYFRERSSDVRFLGDRILRNMRGEHPAELVPPPGAVVVAHDIGPADTAHLARASVAAIVTDVGGKTSHSAIMARSLEIPAVVGVEGFSARVTSGDLIVVDAIHGCVVVRPDAVELARWADESAKYEAFEARVQREHALPATTRDGLHVRLRANVGLDEEVSSALFHGAEGIGLFRTEFLFMERETAPTEEEHYRAAKAVLRRMAPYPVTMRTFDLGGDKCSRFLTVAPETNPAMGLRSLRLAFREREIFSAQLRGLMRAALHGPLRIMLPLVSGLGELRMALDMVRDARLQLVDAGLAHAEHVEVGIMIEMPSAAVVADLLVEHVDFVSIGTNDLIQYTLGIDRENESVEYLYRPLHPAILRLIAGVAAAARAKGVPVSLCGEMAADPRYVWILVGLGVEELSMHPSAIPVIKSVIRGSSHREMVELAHRVCACGDGDEAEALVLSVMGPRFSEHLQHGASVAPPPQPEDSLK